MHILIAGGRGFLGSYLAKSLSQHHEVTILSRNPEKTTPKPRINIAFWDGKNLKLSPKSRPVDAIINLSGLSIARFWSKSTKKALRESRIIPTKTLVNWIKQQDKKPKVMIQVSGIDYYDMKTPVCDENSAQGHTFLAQLANDWEAATQGLGQSNTRLIIARLAPVLALTHPPLQPLWLSTRCFAGSIIGDGKQYFSWIHHQDFTSIMQHFLEQESHHGIYNVCAPHPVSQREMMQSLAECAKRPLLLSMPEWAAKTLMGEVSTLVLDSRNVVPKRLLQANYTFTFPTIQKALQNLCETKT
jgi:uncharacterized protein (TIGR01777 family)